MWRVSVFEVSGQTGRSADLGGKGKQLTSWKTKAAVGVGALGLALGAMNALAPEQEHGNSGTSIERDTGDLSDSDSNSRDRMREQGGDGINDDNRERVRPVEPTLVRPKIRIRLP